VRYAPGAVTTEREIDVAFALEGVSSVVDVYALRPGKSGREEDACDFAVALRPNRGLTLAEAHYRLLNVLTQAECGRVLFFDADAREPFPMHRATPLTVPSGAREAATIRAMERVEAIAKRHEDEREQAKALKAPPPPVSPEDLDRRDARLVFERNVDVQIALEEFAPVRAVFVVERRKRGEIVGFDVFVELPLDPDVIFEAHRRVVDRLYGTVGRVLYGNAEMRLRYLGHRIPIGGSDRPLAERRRELRDFERPVLDWRPLRTTIDQSFADGNPTSPIVLRVEGSARRDDEEGMTERSRVLLFIPMATRQLR
jgi:hypothetical protein